MPPVHGRDTFWREKYPGPRRAAASGAGPATAPATGPGASNRPDASGLAGAPPGHADVHLPAPSHWPVVLALGLGLAVAGALIHVAVVVLGGALTLYAAFRFALEHHRNPSHVHQEGTLGIDHRKVAMWTFIGSECLFFGTLIATYMAYRGRSVVGPHPAEILDIPLTTLSTFDLLMSSLLMVLALAAVQRGDHAQTRLWLAGTVVFGLVFLGFQAYEFTHFVHQGLTLQRNLFGSTFFVLTGLHGAHVALGVAWLGALLILDLRDRLAVTDAVKVEVAGLYWHFVDVVWIVIFTLVYLVP
ncbi:MAG: cytochrome c oxidase subunit 3 [Candidatus Rokuibacteriota bacterium]